MTTPRDFWPSVPAECPYAALPGMGIKLGANASGARVFCPDYPLGSQELVWDGAIWYPRNGLPLNPLVRRVYADDDLTSATPPSGANRSGYDELGQSVPISNGNLVFVVGRSSKWGGFWNYHSANAWTRAERFPEGVYFPHRYQFQIHEIADAALQIEVAFDNQIGGKLGDPALRFVTDVKGFLRRYRTIIEERQITALNTLQNLSRRPATQEARIYAGASTFWSTGSSPTLGVFEFPINFVDGKPTNEVVWNSTSGPALVPGDYPAVLVEYETEDVT
jgi:hypothetical protein